jgi:hypothetical protein
MVNSMEYTKVYNCKIARHPRLQLNPIDKCSVLSWAGLPDIAMISLLGFTSMDGILAIFSGSVPHFVKVSLERLRLNACPENPPQMYRAVMGSGAEAKMKHPLSPDCDAFAAAAAAAFFTFPPETIMYA